MESKVMTQPHEVVSSVKKLSKNEKKAVLAMALSLVGNKMSTFKVIMLTVLAGIPMGVGSFLGAYFADMCNSMIGAFLAIAAGTMMYVVLEEILPSTKSIFTIIGFLVGILIVSYI